MKSKSGFGTFSNNGLSCGIPEPSQHAKEEMEKIVSDDIAAIKTDFTAQLTRLDHYIKTNIGAIPSTDDFVDWFFSKKKITQWGKNLRAISDDDIFKCAKIYIAELDRKLKPANQVWESMRSEPRLTAF